MGSVEKSRELCQHRKKIRGLRRFSEVWHMRMDDFSTLPLGNFPDTTILAAPLQYLCGVP